MLQFGLGSSSAVLKNEEKYPTLQLLSEVENTHSSARVSFVESEGWSKVATIAENYEDFILVRISANHVTISHRLSMSKHLYAVASKGTVFQEQNIIIVCIS